MGVKGQKIVQNDTKFFKKKQTLWPIVMDGVQLPQG